MRTLFLPLLLTALPSAGQTVRIAPTALPASMSFAPAALMQSPAFSAGLKSPSMSLPQVSALPPMSVLPSLRPALVQAQTAAVPQKAILAQSLAAAEEIQKSFQDPKTQNAGFEPLRRHFDGGVSVKDAVSAPSAASEASGAAVKNFHPAAVSFNGQEFPLQAFTDETVPSRFLVQAIDATKKTLDIAIHGLTLPEVADALSRAKERGVRVRIVMNSSHVYPEKPNQKVTPDVQRLLDEGFEMRMLRGDREHGLMHNKFAVFDGALLVSGSYNWSKAADKYHLENMLFTAETNRLQGFQGYWDWMWALAKPFGEPAGRPSGKPPVAKTRPIQFNGAGLPAFAFSPGGDAEYWLVQAVELARETIDIAMFSCTSRDMREALLSARKRGVKVRIVFDRFQYRMLPDMAWFLENGFDVRLGEGKPGPKGAGSMHNKFVVFDGKVLEAGSYNWTMNAKMNNFENAQFFDEAARVAAFRAYYGRIWQAAKPAAKGDAAPPPPARS